MWRTEGAVRTTRVWTGSRGTFRDLLSLRGKFDCGLRATRDCQHGENRRKSVFQVWSHSDRPVHLTGDRLELVTGD